MIFTVGRVNQKTIIERIENMCFEQYRLFQLVGKKERYLHINPVLYKYRVNGR